MDEEGLLDFSGQEPSIAVTSVLLEDENALDVLQNFSDVVISSTLAPLLPFATNYYHIGFLVVKTLLALLAIVLTAALKRDFFKSFGFFLLLPILADVGFDIYTEIKANTALFQVSEQPWTYFTGDYYQGALSALHSKTLVMYEDMLVHYTTYLMLHELKHFALFSFIILDFLFWAFLFNVVLVFYYAQKAVLKPEEINYIPTFLPFLKLQIFPVLLTTIDTLLAEFEVPAWLSLSVTGLVRVIACGLALVITLQILGSLFVFCRRRDEYTRSSPYDSVRCGKWRLTCLIMFAMVACVGTAPYWVWSGVSLAEDFLVLTGLADPASLPLHLAADCWQLHLTVLPLRSFLLPFLMILLLAPYRKKFCRTFCSCCLRK